MEQTHNIQEIDFLSLFNKDSFVIAIIGSSGSGKTTLIKHMLNLAKNEYTHIFLFQGSAPSEDNIYTDFIWPADIYYITDLEDKTYKQKFKLDINNYHSIITGYNSDIKDKNKQNAEQISLIKTLFIFDDFGPYNKYFSDFANVSRHSLSSFIFIIHNDTDLDLTFRKKITHFFINVCFSLNQISEHFKDLKSLYDDTRKKFIENNQKKSFIILDRDNQSQLQYCNLQNIHVENLKQSNSIFYRCSKQRNLIKKLLQQLAKNLRTEENINQ